MLTYSHLPCSRVNEAKVIRERAQSCSESIALLEKKKACFFRVFDYKLIIYCRFDGYAIDLSIKNHNKSHLVRLLASKCSRTLFLSQTKSDRVSVMFVLHWFT